MLLEALTVLCQTVLWSFYSFKSPHSPLEHLIIKKVNLIHPLQLRNWQNLLETLHAHAPILLDSSQPIAIWHKKVRCLTRIFLNFFYSNTCFNNTVIIIFLICTWKCCLRFITANWEVLNHSFCVLPSPTIQFIFCYDFSVHWSSLEIIFLRYFGKFNIANKW